MKIAVYAGRRDRQRGDSRGPQRSSKEAARKFGFTYTYHRLPLRRRALPENKTDAPGVRRSKELAAHDAILFGAVGVDPRGSAQIPQGILEAEILLKMRFGAGSVTSIFVRRNCLPGVPTPLKNVGPGDIDMIIVRENTEGCTAVTAAFFTRTRRTRWPSDRSNHAPWRRTRHPLRLRTTPRSSAQKGHVGRQDQRPSLRHNLWIRAFEEVKTEYPVIQTDYHHVDACTM